MIGGEWKWDRRAPGRLCGFHFSTQPSVTYEHPGAPTRWPVSPKRLFRRPWVFLGAKIGGLKIRVSVVRFRPWPPLEKFMSCARTDEPRVVRAEAWLTKRDGEATLW